MIPSREHKSPRVSTGFAIVSVSFFCVFGMAACGIFSTEKDTPRPPSPSPVTSAEKDASGLILQVSDIETVVEGSIPGEVNKGRYWHNPFSRRDGEQFLSWKVFDSSHNRDLTLQVKREATVAVAKRMATYVEDELANDHVREGRQVVDTGPIAAVPQIADECLSFSIARKNAMSAIPEDDGQKYSMSGRYLYCRFENVNIVVDWEGLDYSRPWAIDEGRGLDQAAADRDVQRIARVIVQSLR